MYLTVLDNHHSCAGTRWVTAGFCRWHPRVGIDQGVTEKVQTTLK